MAKSWLSWTLGVSSLVVAAVGCAAKDDDGIIAEPSTVGPTGGSGAPSGAGAIDAGSGLSNAPVTFPDAGSGVTYLDAGAGAAMCVSTKAMAPPGNTPKIDIVWVVDTSQSMFGEQNLIKANLASFADGITKASIDVGITMVSKYPTLIPGPFQVPGLCPETPPDPLAGTPLATDPRYHFLETEVGSPEPLNVAIARYPQYSQFLRAGSAVHFIIVTDDEAAYKGAGSPMARATQFQADMMALLGRPFQVHVIASPPGQRCTSTNCALDPNQGICALIDLGCQAAAGGDTHYALATLTKGLSASICEADWTPIFKKFQEAVIKSAPLPCDYVIPPPPKDEMLNFGKVNVAFTPPGGSEETIGQAPNMQACPGNKPAWYYDNPDKPSKVVLCPTACTAVANGGAMNIVYGCKDTIILN